MKKFNLLFGLLFVMFSFASVAQEQFQRKVVQVPKVNPESITVDGQMNEAEWQNAASLNIFTSSGSEMWANQYYREDLVEPDYDEISAKLLWSRETLYVFIHIDEIVNDSTDLFWAGKWTGDQLFVSLSDRLGLDYHPGGAYNGNIFTVPDGPYYFVILGDQLTLNGGDTTWIPDEWQRFDGDTIWAGEQLDASRFANMKTFIDKENGVWNIEMAIYNPGVDAQSAIGFNIGGSTGSEYFHNLNEDGYSYWTWQPNVPNDPYAAPQAAVDLYEANGTYVDPGSANLATTRTHAVLKFTTGISSVRELPGNLTPASFSLYQNYPNPFNPTTNIRFSIDKPGLVSLKVYNVLGQVVATLINGQNMSTGTYEATLDARNLASGIYMYELRVDNTVTSKKMVLLK
jgi:hypothetical protein